MNLNLTIWKCYATLCHTHVKTWKNSEEVYTFNTSATYIAYWNNNIWFAGCLFNGKLIRLWIHYLKYLLYIYVYKDISSITAIQTLME